MLIATNTGLWGLTLIIGVVVLLAVAVLLSLLYRKVVAIDSELDSLLDAGGQVRTNTAKINDLLTTYNVLGDIHKEVLIHDQYLARK
jgi:low affinity Fe/Cu permease